MMRRCAFDHVRGSFTVKVYDTLAAFYASAYHSRVVVLHRRFTVIRSTSMVFLLFEAL